MTQQGNQTQAY